MGFTGLSSVILFFQVVLEGLWPEGFMAMAAVGATNIGSIEVECPFSDYTHMPRWRVMHTFRKY